jgi:hypothetical protein
MVLLLAIGLAAGVLSGLFGIGGGVVIIPALIYLGRMTPTEATGTSLAALLLPVGLLGALEYHRAGQLKIATALVIAVGLFLGAGLGARLALYMPPTYLRRLFAGFLVVVAIRLWMD